jgi:predicted RNA-binding protein with PIN domain
MSCHLLILPSFLRGQGCRLLSARDLKEEMNRAEKSLREEIVEVSSKERHTIADALTNDTIKQLYQETPEE